MFNSTHSRGCCLARTVYVRERIMPLVSDVGCGGAETDCTSCSIMVLLVSVMFWAQPPPLPRTKVRLVTSSGSMPAGSGGAGGGMVLDRTVLFCRRIVCTALPSGSGTRPRSRTSEVKTPGGRPGSGMGDGERLSTMMGACSTRPGHVHVRGGCVRWVAGWTHLVIEWGGV